jgi:signal transduction histidine kinase
MLRRNMVADVAHELRTPLSVLQGNLRAILDDVYPLEKAEVARLYDQTRLLSHMVNDLHELAQAEARQLPMHFTHTDMADLVENVAGMFAPVAEAEGVGLKVDVGDDLPDVRADSARLSQVMNNLLVNALRHTPKGGCIELRAARENGHVRLDVEDTGEGISRDHLPHVFERFYRADRARSRATGGAGLGLAIAKAIIHSHNGDISVSSEGVAGKGTIFTIRLPVEK